jgi:aurora kinase
MATRGLESRFERLSVNDENDPGDGSKAYQKSKVIAVIYNNDQILIFE